MEFLGNLAKLKGKSILDGARCNGVAKRRHQLSQCDLISKPQIECRGWVDVTSHSATQAPLAFRKKVEDVWTANPLRLFLDLRQDPRRGRERTDRLHEEVIGL